MKVLSQVKILAHIIGYVAMLFAAFWLFYCFIEINTVGYVYGVGMEPNRFIAVSELALTGYAFVYGVYLLVKVVLPRWVTMK